jgi:hypothetical protein
VMILPQRNDRHAQTAGHSGHAYQQGLLQLGAFYSCTPESTWLELAVA